MGESYGNFDPLGKIAFLDQLEKIEDGVLKGLGFEGLYRGYVGKMEKNIETPI